MAFPATESNSNVTPGAGGAFTSGNTAATSHDLVLPATISADSLLLVIGRVAAAGAVSFPAGWTVNQDSSDASDDVSFWAYKSAVGDEDSTNVSVSHGSGKIAGAVFSITGAADPATTPPEASTVAVGTGANPDANTCTPTGGAKDYLWFTSALGDGEHALAATTPTNYANTENSRTGTASTPGTNCVVHTARRTNNAASEDAGAWTETASVNSGWTAWTIAVHPPGAEDQDIPVGQVSITTTAQPFGRDKSAAVGLATETDTALPITPAKTRAVGIATETDTAFPISGAKTKAIGLATETDTALPIGVAKIVAVGLATETVTALPITPAKTLAVGLVSETDQALPITVIGGFQAERADLLLLHAGK